MPTDILLGDDLDLIFRNGDLVVGESTEQHQKLLLVNDKGHMKHAPFAGVGIMNYTNDDVLGELYGEIQRQFEIDGMVIHKLEIRGVDDVDLEASYE